jgi:hypothetical protein
MNYLVTQGTKKRGRHGKGIVYLTLNTSKNTGQEKLFSNPACKHFFKLNP